MPTAENALLQYEAGQVITAMSALTDSGDHTTYTSSATLFSGRSGYAPNVKPNGLATGGAIVPAVSGTNDLIDVAATTAYIGGSLISISADTEVAITRPATDVAKINAVTVTSAGAVEVIAGTDSADTSFSTTVGGAGGPPYIPVTSVKIGEVRLLTSAAAAIESTEIFSVVGLHTERYDYPLWEEQNELGKVEFSAALDLIHTGDLPKGVFAEYSEPLFADVALASDFVPAETSHSVNSTQIYGTTLGSTSSTLGQGGFTAYVNDGITDALVVLKNEVLWFKFFPNRYEAPYLLTQGKLGITRSYPAGDSIQAECTISASSESTEQAS